MARALRSMNNQAIKSHSRPPAWRGFTSGSAVGLSSVSSYLIQKERAMQKTSLRMTKASPRPLQEAAAEIRHFSLRDLLPPHHLLALNLTLGTLAQLACEEGLPRLIAEQQF